MPLRVEYTPPKVNAALLVGAAADAGVKAAAEHLLSVSVNLCPKQDGNLRDSGEVTDFTGLDAGGQHLAAVSYGREDGTADHASTEDYAIRQHEERDYHHDVGEWGWLVKPMDSERGALLGLAAAPIKAVLGP